MLADKDSLQSAALETASLIASKSPVAVQGTKLSLLYSRDHSVRESLDHVVCNIFFYSLTSDLHLNVFANLN